MTDQLVSNGIYLDLSENIPIPINLSIADAKEPSKRKRNYSKTINLAGTMTNMEYFSGVFSLSVTDNTITFDATVKAPVILYKKGLPVMPNGVLKLNSVTINDGDVKSFECQIFSETVDYFLLLNSIRVGELDWSDYDHTLTRANIIASWSTPIGSSYYYPLIERGRGRPAPTIFRTIDLVPYVYSREVMVKIFEWLDIEFTSVFLDTTRYKSKLFGYGGGLLSALTPTAINNRKFDLNAGDYIYTVYPNSFINGSWGFYGQSFNPFLDSTFASTIAQDILGQWDNGELTIQYSGNYSLSIVMALDYQYNYSAGTFVSATGFQLQVLKNGGGVYTMICQNQVITVDSGTFTLNTNPTQTLLLESGDVISFRIVYGAAIITGGAGVSLDVTTNGAITIDLISLDTDVTDNSNMQLGQFLPDMKCSEFLLGEIRHHNLYLSDPDDDGVVTIEPLSDGFYQPTNDTDDWTELLDHDKDIVIKPTANDYAKKLQFKFKKNTDEDAKTYLDKWESEYGDLEYEQGSYYAKGDQKIELPWSTIIPYQLTPNILIPRFIKIQNGVISPNKGAARVMMRNGLKSGNWTLRNSLNAVGQQLTTYPCVHHFDNWTAPTFDLNWQLVKEVFYTATIVTTVNAFSVYYFEPVNEMTNKAGKLFTGYFKLDPYLVKTIDFSRLKMLNGTLWRLNEVNDFDDNVQATTKCELIKVLEAKSPNRSGTAPNPNSLILVGSVTAPSGVAPDVGVIGGGFNDSSPNSNLIRG